MKQVPISQRVFPLRLSAWLPARYAAALHWLRSLLDRLGEGPTRALWQQVCQHGEDELLVQILGSGWYEIPQDAGIDLEGSIDPALHKYFRAPVEGVTGEQAKELVDRMPLFRQIKGTLSTLNLCRQTTTYEALHLGCDAIARLVEALVRSHGKQGELIAYDVQRADRLRVGGGQRGSVAEFIADFTREPLEPNIFTAGLNAELVYASKREAVVHVKECEWARYYQERHPQVGYLMACSTDEAAYRAFNPALRMQRTATLMEAGQVCDFRVFAVDEGSGSE
jgi:hypothetical protein